MVQTSLEIALNSFTQALTKKGKSTNTIVAYKGDINQLIHFLAPQNITNIDQVETAHLENFKKDLEIQVQEKSAKLEQLGYENYLKQK